MNRRPLMALLAPLAVGTLVLGGCSDSSDQADPAAADVVRMWVGPERAECTGVAPMECLVVSYTEDGESQLFYDTIAGFEHEEGTAYVLDVRVAEVPDPPADGSSLAYTLVSVVSQEPQ